MIIDLLKYLGWFLLLVLLQVLLLNNIQISGFLNPYLYILFIIMLPFQTPVWLITLLSFVLGLSIDMFANTPGLHASATVLMGYSRKTVLSFFSPREGFEYGTAPTLSYLGFTWYLYYSSIMTVIHHFTFFYLETFSFGMFFSTFFRFLLSSMFTVSLIFLTQYLTRKSSEKE